MNFSRATFVLLAAALALMATVHWKGRTQDRESFNETQNALNELRGQIESQNQLLAELRLQLAEQELRSSVAPPSATATDAVNEPLNQILAMLHQQSNALAVVQGQMPVVSAESPEERRLRSAIAIADLRDRHAAQQLRLKFALDQLDALQVSLGIPDEIAQVKDTAKLSAKLSRESLAMYRPFFDFRRSYEEAQRFARILELKLAAEQFDATLPLSR